MSLTEKEKNQKVQEKYQAILQQMLREEDNKYCVDCDAKAPRWASWNLGLFLCIRCAGIHRNLGVHISKVKSVNLDSWTSEQVCSMQSMGNSKARAVYEANLPDNYKRPQTDSQLEQFIRAKYEQRKWIAKEWIPPNISNLIPSTKDDNLNFESTKPKSKKTSNTVQLPKSPSKQETVLTKNEKPTPSQADDFDLIGLNSDFVAKPVTTSTTDNKNTTNNEIIDAIFGEFTSYTENAPTNSQQTNSNDLDDLFTITQSTNIQIHQQNQIDNNDLIKSNVQNLANRQQQVLDKNSILALFNNTQQPTLNQTPFFNPLAPPPTQNNFNFMPQQQPQATPNLVVRPQIPNQQAFDNVSYAPVS